jgi:hypothetical protein
MGKNICHFWLLGNVNPNHILAPAGSRNSHYKISFYEPSEGTYMFVRDGNVCIWKLKSSHHSPYTLPLP